MDATGARIELTDLDAVRVYGLPMRNRFRGITVRQGVLLRGPAGWGEFCPFDDYGDAESVPWLATALEACAGDWPEPVRDSVPVNCTVPVVTPEKAHEIAAGSGCATAKVKVAESGRPPGEDVERVAAVRDALGPGGAVRVDANAAWDVDTAVARIRELDRAAGGLEYVEQPCPSVDELAAVRRRVEVRIAADESIRRAEDPMRVAVAGAADVAVIKVSPLGGVRRALRVAEASGLPCVVSSAVESSVGLAAQLALAGALPELPFACGLGTITLLEGDVVADSLVPSGGRLPVPRRPPEPTPALVAAATPPADVQRRWLDRLRRVHALLPAG
ncbi:O-succinylbenzoate synthase [Saccharopolyspora erythraea NRRL 2338]|uniref:o-succinylbenzoate synthase n=3 Tax=Saccharopolyspora erythraea TaxID=1836 RepID=A4F763_SACEN|nr:o-succinylbenzoate synthase [Saccharopolyspora erythraea]PFG93690.1 O-succinylbenzoate synthase [Saccharopolyspora erythraea NRRL 2338]QRK90534.1 o-succinylbenzoate synthase [Saccharopolyspora erythraea]CAL99887.1 O-succinylbenzoate-CoA synthase [Saccharopolyspora erythraea NRRL 2338]